MKRQRNMQHKKFAKKQMVKSVKPISNPLHKINQYRCKVCEGVITTVQIGEAVNGTTPMMLDCHATENCDGTMMSMMYLVSQDLLPDYEWYKPKKLPKDRGMRQHVELGGLLIRAIGWTRSGDHNDD